jgi:hypothetical protein
MDPLNRALTRQVLRAQERARLVANDPKGLAAANRVRTEQAVKRTAAQRRKEAQLARELRAEVRRIKRETVRREKRDALLARREEERQDAIRTLGACPAVARFVALWRDPETHYNSSEARQAALIDAIDDIHPRTRKLALGLPVALDPFAPFLGSLRHLNDSDGLGLRVIAHVYGVTHEYIRLLEASGLRKARESKPLRDIYSAHSYDRHNDTFLTAWPW